LVENAPIAAARLREGGWFLFGGCRGDHREELLAALEGAGLSVERERARGRWLGFAGRRWGGSRRRPGSGERQQ
jgi:ribosomal protein L11 methylase PrmA